MTLPRRSSTQGYRIEVRHPDGPCLVYDLTDPDEPCVFVAQNADEADAWVLRDAQRFIDLYERP